MRILQCSISCACAQAIIDGAPVVRHYSRIYEASPLLGRLICVARGGALPHELRGLLAAVKAKAVAPFAGSRIMHLLGLLVVIIDELMTTNRACCGVSQWF